MIDMQEALRVAAEQILLETKIAMHRPRLGNLRSKYVLEQDDVNRMENGVTKFFSRWRGGYDEKLEKERSDVEAAKRDLDDIMTVIEASEKRLAAIQADTEEAALLLGNIEPSVLQEDEKALYFWGQKMETCKDIVLDLNGCLHFAQAVMRADGAYTQDPYVELGIRAGSLNRKTQKFFAEYAVQEKLDTWESILTYLCTSPSMPMGYRGEQALIDGMAKNDALFDLDRELKRLQEVFVRIVETFAEEGERLLERGFVSESHICEIGMKWDRADLKLENQGEPQFTVDKLLALCEECIAFGERETAKVFSGNAEKDTPMLFQKKTDEVYHRVLEYMKSVGKVREFSGITKKTLTGVKRYTAYGGKTIMFLRNDHPAKECHIHPYHLSEKMGWAQASMMEQMVKDLKELRTVLTELAVEKPNDFIEANPNDIHIEETPMPEMAFEGFGLYGEVDLRKEKERVLFGLELLQKDWAQIGQMAYSKETQERIRGWERALREWQNDLKQYRKNAGNFTCGLDKYEMLERKIWQYTEDEKTELRKAYQMHLQDTAERLRETVEQVREHGR